MGRSVVPRRWLSAMRLRVVILFLASALAAVLGGCHLESELGDARIINDTPYAVDVMLCRKDDCSKEGFPFSFENQYFDKYPLKPRAVARYLRVEYGSAAVYRVVRTIDGEELGCLPLVIPEPGPPLLAKVSQQVPCRGNWDEDVRWPK